MGAHARVDVAESTAAATRHSRSERSDRRANHALDLDVSGAASPGADVVARMLRSRNCPVPAQSRCRCGKGAHSPGADVAAAPRRFDELRQSRASSHSDDQLLAASAAGCCPRASHSCAHAHMR